MCLTVPTLQDDALSLTKLETYPLSPKISVVRGVMIFLEITYSEGSTFWNWEVQRGMIGLVSPPFRKLGRSAFVQPRGGRRLKASAPSGCSRG